MQGTPGLTYMPRVAATIQSGQQCRFQVTLMVSATFRSTHLHCALPQWFLDCVGLSLTDHTLTVPLDYSGATEGEQQLFVREVVAHGRAKQHALPYLLFLQGAPFAH